MLPSHYYVCLLSKNPVILAGLQIPINKDKVRFFMIFSLNFYRTMLLTLLLTFSCHLVFAGQPTSTTPPLHLTGYVDYINTNGGFWGIIGDDGQKYQPTNLPHKLRTSGLPIKFDAKINDNIVTTFMWGTIVDVTNVKPLSAKISNNDRGALYIFQKRMDAFNTKDLALLQQVDTLSEKLTPEQFTSWIGDYNNYTLQYLEVSSANSFSLIGTCYYTRELKGEKRLEGNIELSATNFTISKTKTGWKLTDLETIKNPVFTNKETLLADLKQKSMEKYKTNQLATLLQ